MVELCSFRLWCEACPCLAILTETLNTLHLFRLLQKSNPFAWSFTVHPYFRFILISLLLILAALCVIVSLSLLVFHALFDCLCFACAAVFASVSIFSLLRSRSQSLEGNEQLGEVQEEEDEVGKRGGGEGERKATNVARSQMGCKESGGEVDTEHQQNMVEKEEDLYQRSISETDLR